MKPLRFFHATLACLLALGAGVAMAQSEDPAGGQRMQAQLQKRFAAADANGDGRLSKEEAKGKMPMVYKHFEEIDTSHSGSVSMADIAAYARARHQARASAPTN